MQYVIYNISYVIYHIDYRSYYSRPSEQSALPVVNCGNGASEMLVFGVNVTAELTRWLRNG